MISSPAGSYSLVVRGLSSAAMAWAFASAPPASGQAVPVCGGRYRARWTRRSGSLARAPAGAALLQGTYEGRTAKAERFIQTSLREWAYARAYQSSAERGHAMLPLDRRIQPQPTSLSSRWQTAARKAEQRSWLRHLGERLVRDFRARLISGEYVATGFQPPSIERVRIPAELHSGLDFDFENGTEKGDGYTFSHILIIQSCGSVGNGFEVSERIAAWLIERRAGQGEELKKALLHAARTEFGSEFRSRAIDAAYYRIYARARGRPRSTRG